MTVSFLYVRKSVNCIYRKKKEKKKKKVYFQTFRNNRRLAYFLRNLQTSRASNSRILKIKNAKFSGYCFYIKTNIYGDFQICVSVPLNVSFSALPLADYMKLRATKNGRGWGQTFHISRMWRQNRFSPVPNMAFGVMEWI